MFIKTCHFRVCSALQSALKAGRAHPIPSYHPDQYGVVLHDDRGLATGQLDGVGPGCNDLHPLRDKRMAQDDSGRRPVSRLVVCLLDPGFWTPPSRLEG